MVLFPFSIKKVARLLQAWGTQDPTRYEQAVNGITTSQQKSPIWGWGKVALAAVRYPQFRDTFYESRYELANCHLALASSKSGDEKQTLLRDAEQNLSKTAKLYPSMGDWEVKYDELLKQVQAALGKPSIGLELPAPSE